MPSLSQSLLLRLALRSPRPWTEEKARERKTASWAESWVSNWLGSVNTPKSMGPGGLHPWVRRQLANVYLPISIIFEKSWRMGEVSDD